MFMNFCIMYFSKVVGYGKNINYLKARNRFGIVWI